MSSENVDAMTGEIVEVDSIDAHAVIESMQMGRKSVYSTIVGSDFTSKLATVQAMANSVQLSDNLDKPIELANYVMQAVTLKGESGAMVEAIRTVLIDAQGVSYATVSNGVIKSLENLVGVCGTPDLWDSPVKVTPTEVRGRSGFRFITLNIG